MTLFDAIILGIIQGISEFLPVSSSGHLILFQNLLHIKEPTMTFDVLLHVGTLVPIFAVYWTEIVKLIKKPFQKLTYLLIIGTLPAVLVAILFKDQIDAMFTSVTWLLAVGFAITGLLLLYADEAKVGRKKTEEITYVDALIIGAMQGVAVAPAISRSGSTISASLFRKLDRQTAAMFSFLLSIPAIAGAVVLEIIKIIKASPADAAVATINPLYMIVGFFAAMISGYFAINFMLDLIRKAKLKYFAFYVFALAALILVDKFVLSGTIFG